MESLLTRTSVVLHILTSQKTKYQISFWSKNSTEISVVEIATTMLSLTLIFVIVCVCGSIPVYKTYNNLLLWQTNYGWLQQRDRYVTAFIKLNIMRVLATYILRVTMRVKYLKPLYWPAYLQHTMLEVPTWQHTDQHCFEKGPLI